MATIQWRRHKTKRGVTVTATLQWSDDSGRHRESLGDVTKEQAETALAVKEAELRTGQQIYSVAPLFGEIAETYLEWRASEFPDSQFRVEQIVRDHLIPNFQYMAGDQIQPLQAERYKADALKERSEGSVAKEIRTLKAILNRSVRWGLIRYNPLDAVEPPRVRHSRPVHWYEMGELREIYLAAGNRAPVWQFMANTGLRRGEAQHLRREHDKGDRVAILSEPGARTKSRKWREVPLSVNGRAALDALLAASDGDFILPRMNPSSLSRAFAQDKPDHLGGSLHSLRHTFGTLQALKGTPIRVLKELMGHATIKTTERYMHVAQSHLADAIDGFSI